jgi:hypothetical protein
VTSGLLLVKLLQGATLRDALEHAPLPVYEIMTATKNMQEYELQVVAAQDRIAKPEHYFSATALTHPVALRLPGLRIVGRVSVSATGNTGRSVIQTFRFQRRSTAGVPPYVPYTMQYDLTLPGSA